MESNMHRDGQGGTEDQVTSGTLNLTHVDLECHHHQAQGDGCPPDMLTATGGVGSSSHCDVV
jgi:hypothetical protein